MIPTRQFGMVESSQPAPVTSLVSDLTNGLCTQTIVNTPDVLVNMNIYIYTQSQEFINRTFVMYERTKDQKAKKRGTDFGYFREVGTQKLQSWSLL